MSDAAHQPMVGLHIIAPASRRSIPSATAACKCGHERRARGKQRVLALVEAYTAHRAICTGQPTEATSTDRRTAA